jgi:hypothetical protein
MRPSQRTLIGTSVSRLPYDRYALSTFDLGHCGHDRLGFPRIGTDGATTLPCRYTTNHSALLPNVPRMTLSPKGPSGLKLHYISHHPAAFQKEEHVIPVNSRAAKLPLDF